MILKRLWARWKTLARVIGDFQARVLLSLFYFVLLSPFALGVRLFSDPLRLKRRNVPRWIPRIPEKTESREEARRQF